MRVRLLLQPTMDDIERGTINIFGQIERAEEQGVELTNFARISRLWISTYGFIKSSRIQRYDL